ncbi:MAG: hypothetical protein U9N49_08795, partial [Campylobacterota bacterium]|nr:hypothetical protein [Campylobacterota bacterium]
GNSMFFKRNTGLSKPRSQGTDGYGRVYVLKITLDDGEDVITIVKDSQVLEILDRFQNNVTLIYSKEFMVKNLVIKHLHNILDEWRYDVL